MENEVKQRNLQRNRRRERAQRMQAQRESKVKDGDSGEDESPAREKPPRPPARRKKSREPLAEEDIIDGFAIMAFRTYEDLEAAVKCASSPRTNALSTKPRLPLAALASDTGRNHPTNVNSHGITLLQDAGTSDDSGRASERLTGSSVAPRDPDSSRDRLSDCDSEGDDDKASPDNSRNASPRYHDVSMEDASEAGSLFRVTSATGGGGGKNELVARGGSGGALALSRAPVGGSASPAPAPLPQPAPSPAPAALPPPALPPPHRPNGAHIPAMEGHAAAAAAAASTQIPAKPVGAASGPNTPERPASNSSKLQPGARAAADSPTPAPPAPPAPSPLFPSHAAYQSQSHAAAALPDYRHTNHETRTEKPPEQPPPAPLDLHAHHAPRPPPPRPPAAPSSDVEMRSPAAPTSTQPSSVPTSFPARTAGLTPVTAPLSNTPAIPTCLPSQALSGRSVSPAAPTSRPYPAPAIGSSHVSSAVSSGIHGHAMPSFQSQASLMKHSVQSVYASRPSHLAPFGLPPALVSTNHVTQPTYTSHSIMSHATGHHPVHPLSHPHAMSAPSHLVPLPMQPTTTAALSSYSSGLKHPGLVQPHPGPLMPPSSSHHTMAHVDLTTSSSNAPTVSTTSSNSSTPLAPPVIDSRQPTSAELPSRTESSAIVSSGLSTNGFPPPAIYSGSAYPPLYAPYATTLQHSPYLPPSAASPRNSADARTGLSASPLVAPKTPKGVRPHTPGSTGAAGSALTSYSPGPSPTRERESFSNISSLSRSTPGSSAATTAAALAPSLIAPLAAPMAAPLAAPLPAPLSAPLAGPIPGQLSGPLAPPLAAPIAPLGPPLTTPLAAPTPTPATSSAHLAHSLAPVPTVPSISSSAKPPAHWGVTRSSPADGSRGFAPAPPLFGAPIAPPPNPNPFSAESLFNTSPGADLLRRELDSRFLAVAGAAGAAGVRTEMHHHQHQHTHVHQHPPAAPPQHHPQHPHHMMVPHPPPLFKDVSKMPSLYRSSMGLGYPYSSGLLHPPSPYVPPTPLPYAPTKPVVTAASDSAPKPPPRPAVSKTGRWNAMHVRIAWEIYNHQHKDKPGGAIATPSQGPDKDKMRGFSGAPAPPPVSAAPPPPAPAYRSPYELPPHYLPHHPQFARYEPSPFAPLASHRAGVSPFARYPPAVYPPAPPSFPLSAYTRDLALSSSLHPAVHHAQLPPLHDPWRSAPRVPAPPPPQPSHAAADAARREHEERERARRDREERERRDREERERRKAREQRDRDLERARARSPLRNGAHEPKEERKEMRGAHLGAYPPPPSAAAWDPYRAFDPLQHMRFAPLVEAAIRAEEDRAKMLSAYAHHQQMKASPLVRGAPAQLPPMGAHALSLPPLAPQLPLDLLKKEEPR